MAEKKVASLKLDVSAKRALIEPHHEQISLRRQCELVGLNRASWYHTATPCSKADEDEQLRRLIDEEYTRHPFYGSQRLVCWLRQQGYWVS